MITPEALRLAGRIEYPQFVLTPETRDAAAAELRRQHAEIERLTAALDEARAERSVAYLAFEQVTAERDALRADAERYRWLRNASIPDEQLHVHVDHPAWPNHWALIGEDLDTAIDAALAQTKENGNG
jgi:hypothetical protein